MIKFATRLAVIAVVGVAANWLDGDFNADASYRKWAGDIVCIGISEGWLYLAVILDLHGRRVVG